MTEVGVVICNSIPIFWHLPPRRNIAFLPDSRDLWDVLWEHRYQLDGFGHSHPGSGFPSPSSTDLSTFAAIEAGLGKRLHWWITSKNSTIISRWNPPNPDVTDGLDYNVKFLLPEEEPIWINDLRYLSYTKMNDIELIIKMVELKRKFNMK
jgi:hypothetical protein